MKYIFYNCIGVPLFRANVVIYFRYKSTRQSLFYLPFLTESEGYNNYKISIVYVCKITRVPMVDYWIQFDNCYHSYEDILVRILS